MSIELHEGDVIKASHRSWPEGSHITGPLYCQPDSQYLHCCGYMDVQDFPDMWDIEIVSRAPRAVYVNSDRTEPVDGDVVRDADDATNTATWRWWGGFWWTTAMSQHNRKQLPDRLRLLVDGAAGDVAK